MNRVSRVFFVVLGTFAIYACADSATAPDAAPVSAVGTTAHTYGSGGGRLLRCEDQRSGSASEYIGPRGGRVVVGRNQLIVPAGALNRTVRITATVPDDDIAYVRFEPSGLVFRKSPLLVIDAAGCDIGHYAPDVVYVKHGEILERIDARYYPQYKVVAAPIDHFSGYALAW